LITGLIGQIFEKVKLTN